MNHDKFVIELNQVSYCYCKGENVLDKVSLSVGAGEFVSVIGPSGAGKTTLLRILNGAASACSGEVFVLGRQFDQAKGGAKRRIQRRIGTIYQDFCLVEPSSCLDNVLNGALAETSWIRAVCGIFTREQQNRALTALECVGLAGKADIRAANLSGGQKQRVAIARALMQQPEILLADEPVASLDPATGSQILELLKSIQKQRGLTVIMNSHNVEAALKYSDRICGMRKGKMVFDLPPKQVSQELLWELYRGAGKHLQGGVLENVGSNAGFSEDRV